MQSSPNLSELPQDYIAPEHLEDMASYNSEEYQAMLDQGLQNKFLTQGMYQVLETFSFGTRLRIFGYLKAIFAKADLQKELSEPIWKSQKKEFQSRARQAVNEQLAFDVRISIKAVISDIKRRQEAVLSAAE